MKEVSRRLWRLFLAACSLALCSIGCGDVLGPEKMPVASVDGRVSQLGKPVSRGWIEFVPVDGTVGRMRSARLRSDGTFHATKVPVGLNLIRLVNVDIESIRIRRTFGAFTSPIRRKISEKPGPPLEIDVIAELEKLAPSPPKEKRGEPPKAKALR